MAHDKKINVTSVRGVLGEFERMQSRVDQLTPGDRATFKRQMGFFGNALIWGASILNRSIRQAEEQINTPQLHLTIESVIKHLGKTGSVVGTAYRELSFADVDNYLTEAKWNLVAAPSYDSDWCVYERELDNQRYEVSLTSTSDGIGSVLLVRQL